MSGEIVPIVGVADGLLSVEGVLDADGLVCELRATAAPGATYSARFTIGAATVDLVAGVPYLVPAGDRWSPDVVPNHTVWAGS